MVLNILVYFTIDGVICTLFVLSYYYDILKGSDKIVAVQHRAFSSKHSRWDISIEYSQYLLQEQEGDDGSSLKLSISGRTYLQDIYIGIHVRRCKKDFLSISFSFFLSLCPLYLLAR